jgi:hypothetical protein
LNSHVTSFVSIHPGVSFPQCTDAQGGKATVFALSVSFTEGSVIASGRAVPYVFFDGGHVLPYYFLNLSSLSTKVLSEGSSSVGAMGRRLVAASGANIVAVTSEANLLDCHLPTML